jgi:hypothetical protein
MQCTCDANGMARAMGSDELAVCAEWTSSGQGGGVGA